MIKEAIGFIGEIFSFLKANPDVGAKAIGAVILIIVIRKMMKSEKAREWLRKTGFGVGVSISKLLLAKLPDAIAEWIELLIMDIKLCATIFLDAVMEGMRSDNVKKTEKANKKAIKKTAKIESKAAKAESKGKHIKAKMLRNRIKGRSNL